MKRLASLKQSPLLDELMARLEEAGIDASCAVERTVMEVYMGGTLTATVWIARDEDLERAEAILRELQDSPAAGTAARCPACGYDLEGHRGETTCPECGAPTVARVPDRRCPHCGETVPGTFDVCWNCEAELEAGAEA